MIPHKRKAISPLIAIVIIVALVLAIGVFVSIWLSGIVRVQTETAIVSTKPECQFVFLSATDASLAAGNLTFDLSNIGTANVTLNDIRVTYTNGSSVFADRTAAGLPINITAGDKIPIRVPGVATTPGVSYVRLLTDCSNANIEILGSQIAVAALPPGVLFFDDFESYSLGSDGSPTWNFPRGGTWTVEDALQADNSVGHVFHANWSSGLIFAMISDLTLDDFTFEVKTKVINGTHPSFGALLGIMWRSSNETSPTELAGYVLVMAPPVNTSYLQDFPTAVILGMNNTLTWLENDTWYTLEVTTIGPTITAFIDDVKLFELSNSNHTSGHLGLLTQMSHVYFDDVRITAP